MDTATIFGFVIAIANVVGAIYIGPSPMLFVNIPSLLIVLGGTFGVVLARYGSDDLTILVRALRFAFRKPTIEPIDIIRQFVVLSGISRREGLLALEKHAVDDPFMRKGLNHCIDGTDPERIDEILTQEIAYLARRHETATRILDSISHAAPAFGMIGTLIGLIQMLSGMDDPKVIGPGMAVAIITTLYGVLIAAIFSGPLKDNLTKRTEEEILQKEIIRAGVLGIHRGENSRILGETLEAFLSPRLRSADTGTE